MNGMNLMRIAMLGLLLLAVAGCPKRWTGGAPDFTYTTFGGQSATLSSHAGKPVVLNFWADW